MTQIPRDDDFLLLPIKSDFFLEGVMQGVTCKKSCLCINSCLFQNRVLGIAYQNPVPSCDEPVTSSL